MTNTKRSSESSKMNSEITTHTIDVLREYQISKQDSAVDMEVYKRFVFMEEVDFWKLLMNSSTPGREYWWS